MGKKINTYNFIEKAKLIHGNKYNYTKVEYVNSKTKICIIYPEHGEFWQTPNSHLFGHGCPKCGIIIYSKKLRSNTNDFIKKSILKYGDKFNYNEVEYVNSQIPVYIIHNKCQKGFWIKPKSHLLYGGCSRCSYSIMEEKCIDFLIQNDILFNRKHRKFNWLKHKKNLELDFYLPEYNIAIECQGIQHFEPVEWFGGEKSFFEQRTRDKIKSQLCNDNNLPLYYINYNDDVEEKLNEIINNVRK